MKYILSSSISSGTTIFNLLLFIVNLKGCYFGSSESISVSDLHILRMNFLCFQKHPHGFFPHLTPPIQLQDTYMNNRLFGSSLLFRHEASEAGLE